jgi:small nuclear ribonucleoprotein D3
MFVACIAAGVPIKLLLDAEGHLVTVELKNGEIYRGMLQEVEETMNCQLKEGKSSCLCQ